MSSAIFLTTEDFNVQQGKRGQVLCCNIPGISLVLFFGETCIHCHNILPIFSQLPKNINSCKFGLVNLSKYMNIARMSQQTILPIESVPLMILFVNGKPFLKYSGPPTYENISKFVIDIAARISSKKNFSNNSQTEGDSEPNNNFGIPYNSFDDGFESMNSNGSLCNLKCDDSGFCQISEMGK